MPAVSHDLDCYIHRADPTAGLSSDDCTCGAIQRAAKIRAAERAEALRQYYSLKARASRAWRGFCRFIRRLYG